MSTPQRRQYLLGLDAFSSRDTRRLQLVHPHFLEQKLDLDRSAGIGSPHHRQSRLTSPTPPRPSATGTASDSTANGGDNKGCNVGTSDTRSSGPQISDTHNWNRPVAGATSPSSQTPGPRPSHPVPPTPGRGIAPLLSPGFSPVIPALVPPHEAVGPLLSVVGPLPIDS